MASNPITSQPTTWGQTGSYAGGVNWGNGASPSTASAAAKANDPTDGLASNPVYQALNSDQRNAYQVAMSALGQWNLQALAPDLLSFIQKGYQGDAITYLLSQTDAYKQRFSGNDARVKNGLAPLSPADYLNTEAAYRQVLQASGLPSTFYNSPEDYASLIGADISATELQDRSKLAFKYVNESIDPHLQNIWQNYYGVDQAHLAAHFLDPTAAQASLDRQSNAVDIAAAASRNGLNTPGQARAEQWTDNGITGSQAATAYQKIGDILPSEQDEATRFGTQYNQGTAEDEFLGGLASAQRAREALNSQEQSLWAANSPNNGPTLGTISGGAY